MITSRQNTQVKSWLSLSQKKEREKQKLFLVEGEHLVEEAINSSRCQLLIQSSDYQGAIHFDKVEIISSSVAEKLSSTKSKSDIFALVTIKEMELTGTRWLFLDSIQDPGNVGTLIRSALSFGYDAVILNQNCADPYSDKVVRATQGALFHLIIKQDEFHSVKKAAKKQGIMLVGTYLNQPSQVLPNNGLCLCLGNEGSGLNMDYMSEMDRNVIVETSGFESLNVGVAGSILMFQSKR